MLRKTLTILSLIGLLLSVGLWGVSYYGVLYRRDKVPVSTSILLVAGYLDVGRHRYGSETEYYSAWAEYEPSSRRLVYGEMIRPLSDGISQLAWFTWFPNWYSSTLPGSTIAGVVLPLWIPSAFFGGIFTFSYLLPLHHRRKRKKLGLCVKCGYDLRASVERCPECGTGIASSGV